MANCVLSLEPRTACLSLHSRRAILRTSLFGLGTFASARTLAARPSASQASRSAETACIVFFLDGGPSHHDTFDPKPKLAEARDLSGASLKREP